MNNDLGKSNNKTPLILLLSALVLICFYFIVLRYHDDFKEFHLTKQAEPPVNYHEEQRTIQEENNSYNEIQTISNKESQYLKINPLGEYNYLSKDEIYNIRKRYVKSSLFWTPDYEPSNEIFGQIESGKPWWGVKQIICRANGENTSGISAMSRFINNPNLLVAFMGVYGFSNNEETAAFCNSSSALFMPYKSYYDADNKMITTRYKMSRFIIEHPELSGKGGDFFPFMLVGLNAKDFGYKYVKITKLTNAKMTETPNAAEEIHEFADFVHVGGSCKADGGCNNISPRQSQLEFSLNDYPAEITMELYKRRPRGNIPVYPDLRYKIIFEDE